MNRRLAVMTLLSVIVHLVLLGILPKPSFESTREDPIKSVRIQLKDAQQEETEQTEDDKPDNETESTEGSPRTSSNQTTDRQVQQQVPNRPRDNQQTSDSPSPDREQSEATDQPRDSTTDGTIQPGGTTKDQSSEETTNEEHSVPNEQSNTSTQKETTEPVDSDDPYQGLTRDRRLGSETSAGASSPEKTTSAGNERTVLDEDLEDYELVRTNDRAETGVGELILKEPAETAGETRSLSVPVLDVSRDQTQATPLEPVASGEAEKTRPSKTSRRVLHNPLPETPGWLEQTGQDVRIVLRYVIDADGNVITVSVITSSGYPELDALVARKLKQWKFEPGDSNERRIVVFRFNLTKD